MTNKRAQRGILCVLTTLLMLLACACTKSPEEIRAWYKDNRAPVKMQEFIHNARYSEESKVEALMVLIEHQYINEIPMALSEPFHDPKTGEKVADPIKNDEMNRIVAGAIARLDKMLEVRAACDEKQLERQKLIDAGTAVDALPPEENCDVQDDFSTRVKDAAYVMLKLELNDNNHDRLIEYITDWLADNEHFFRPMNKAGRIEQRRLLELLGPDALPIFKSQLRYKLDQLYAALEKEEKMIAEAQAEGKKIKRIVRPSDGHVNTIAETLNTLKSLNIPGSDNMVAEMFIDEMNKYYPNMPRVLALPFMNNESEKLADMALKIVNDPEYKNENLNYFKDVILVTYYVKTEKKAGVKACQNLLQTDRTGYTRWDCLDILTENAGRKGMATLIQTIPNDYSVLAIPEDHPRLLANKRMTFWNSILVYCSHLPDKLNGDVPIEVLKQLAVKGNTISRIVSMACISTSGSEAEIDFLKGLANDKGSLANWGMQLSTFGELAVYTSKTLEARLNALAKQKEKEAAEAAKKAEAEKAEAEKAAKQAAEKAAIDKAYADAKADGKSDAEATEAANAVKKAFAEADAKAKAEAEAAKADAEAAKAAPENKATK